MIDHRRRLRRLVHLLFFFACFAASALFLTAEKAVAQDQPTADYGQQEGSQPRFGEQIDVRIVTLPVVALDRRGRPVTDLTAEEVTVWEERRIYPIESLTRLMTAPENHTDVPRARLITRLGEQTDVASATVGEPRYMVIVVDVENEPPLGRQEAIDSLKGFLDRQLDPSFRVALMTFDGDLNIVVPFTQDRGTLAAALDAIHAQRQPRARMTPGGRMEQFIQKLATCELDQIVDQECLRSSMYEYAGEVMPQAESLVRALEGVVEYLAGLEGHKSVLTVGGHVTFNPAREAAEAIRARFGNSPEINRLEQSLESHEQVRVRVESLMRLAFENEISFSFLDRTPAPSDHSARQGRRFHPGFRPLVTAFQTAQEDLEEIAVRTGGSFVASTRVEVGLRQSLDLMKAAYYLSLYLPDDEPITSQRLRRIRIQVHRPGVRVTHRRGFEGWRGHFRVPAAEIGGTIEVGEAMQQGLDGTAAELIPLRFTFDPADLDYREKGGSAAAHFGVHLKLRTSEGTLLAESYRFVNHSYPVELWRTGEISPPAMLVFADLPSGDFMAEAVVTVPSRRGRGVLRRQFTVGSFDSGIEHSSSVEAVEHLEAHDAPEQIAAPVASVVETNRASSGPEPPAEADDDRENRASVSFTRHFLGVVAGEVEVGLRTGRDVARVELFLNDEQAGTSEGPPWTISLDLGTAPEPRELTAIARDRHGREIGRARQWLNLPRPLAEMEVVLSRDAGDRLVAHPAFDSVGGEMPLQITAALDGAPLDITDPSAIVLPVVDMDTIHVLRLEAVFEKAGIVARDIVFGGRYVHETNAQLSSVAVQLRQKRDVALDDFRILAHGAPTSVVVVEKGPAELIVIVDPAALRQLPEIVATVRPGLVKMAVSLPEMDQQVTPPESGVFVRLLWPVAPNDAGSEDGGYRLFPSSAPDADLSSAGLIGHLSAASFPSSGGPVRLADAVAVAGPMAIDRSRRRAILLLHGGSPTAGTYAPGAVRGYLEQLRVPLFVWSLTRPTEAMREEWGQVNVVTNQPRLRQAWGSLLRELDQQRVVWIEGTFLPQSLRVVGKNIELAGASSH